MHVQDNEDVPDLGMRLWVLTASRLGSMGEHVHVVYRQVSPVMRVRDVLESKCRVAGRVTVHIT